MLLLLFVFINVQSITGMAQQRSTREIILLAMKDEIHRSINHLKLENLERPFYISYNSI